MSGPIDVLIVEDSAVTRMFLGHLIGSDPRLRVAGVVPDGQAAVDFVQATPPDVVLMDVHMPRMDGFEATRRIMETQPLPIVICSATANTRDVAVVFKALEAGALACIEKPVGLGHAQYESVAAHLLQTVRLMSEVKVVRRVNRTPPTKLLTLPQELAAPRPAAPIRLIGIGASTGGPPVLQTILSRLPKDLPVPLLVVQHIAPGFIAGMADWLSGTTPLPVQLAGDGKVPLPGHVYLAPDEQHFGVAADGAMRLADAPPENHVHPAVSFLFRSLRETAGAGVAAVLLTGMGRDGADELKALRDCGAATIAQDRDSSAVHGMPGAAIALGAALQVLPPERIAAALVELVGTVRAPGGRET